MQSDPYAADVVLAARWSFSVLCCDAADMGAMSRAETFARELARRGHMAVVVEAGPLTTPMMTPVQTADWRNQPARLLLTVCKGAGGIVPTLAAAAANLLSSVACRGIVGVDAPDIWSVIDGQGASVAVHTVADQGQEVVAFGRSALSAAYEVGVRPSSVGRLLISAVLPPGWLLYEVDELASTVANAFDDADTTFMSAVIDPSADTASVLLVCS
jgi:hypothetical protein